MSGQMLVEQMQLQMDLHMKSQKKAQTAILDTALFYILKMKIRKKLLELMAVAEAPLDTEQTLQAAAMAAAQATMLNILLAAEI